MKQKIILLMTIIVIIVLAFLSTPKQEQSMDDFIEEVAQMETIEDTSEADDEKDFQQFAQMDDPVREFLSKRLHRAVQFLFSEEVNIVAIGDSLTAGSGDEEENGGYVGILDQTLNQEQKLVHFTNHGKPGNRSSQLLERLEEKDIQKSIKQAQIVLITIGANDIMHVFKNNFTDLSTIEPFTNEQILYEERLGSILTTIEELNEDASIYLIGFYNPFKPYFADIEELDLIITNWNKINEKVVNRFKNGHFIPMIDIFDDVDDIYLADDNFHPNHFGYELMAGRILQYVMEESGEANEENH